MRPPLGAALRERPLGALFGMRPPRGQHTAAEAEALARHVSGRRSVVEIGVAEGISAGIMRSAMDPAGVLWLVDPFFSRSPISPVQVVARRVVRGAGSTEVRWIRKLSHEAAAGWVDPIDFLFIDGDHAEEACERDWEAWSPHVVPGGRVAFLDSAVSATSHAAPDWGPVIVVDRLFRQPGVSNPEWSIVDVVDSLTVVERK